MESLAFFDKIPFKSIFPDHIDLAFLDGIHLCEILLGEFLNVEKNAKPDSVIALHDCLPLEIGITGRNAALATAQDAKRRNWWLGDVWRTALFLKRNRPDLLMRAYGAPPTGLVCITGLDPKRPFTKDDVTRAKAEMLGYDLSEMGVQAFLAEMEVQAPKLEPEALEHDLTRAKTGRPQPHGPDRVVTLARTAAPHDLETATFSAAKLQAFRGPVLRFQGGIVPPPDDDSFRHFRGGKTVDGFETNLDYANNLKGEYIYGGPLYHHFGHFMAEFVHRILPSHQTFGQHTFVFLTAKGENNKFEKIPPWIQGILDFTGINSINSIIVLIFYHNLH
jgi:hypothetical protein